MVKGGGGAECVGGEFVPGREEDAATVRRRREREGGREGGKGGL
jgi:hypothetical protein